jgi:cytochrome c biogenesis protein CcmG/thiol:disulfide interchange protein DsbE
METIDRTEADQWVAERLALLEPAAALRPDPAARVGEVRLRAAAIRRHLQSRRWAAGVVVAACIASLALSGTRAFAARCADACVSMTTRIRQLLVPAHQSNSGAGLLDAGVRPVAPEFSVTDDGGSRLLLSQLHGQVVLVNFWATWCAPCRTEMPWFAEFQTRFGHRGFRAIGISVDEEGWAAVRPYQAAHPVSYPLALATPAITEAFGGLGALPATFLIDRQGRIAATHVGIVAKATYAEEIDVLVSER